VLDTSPGRQQLGGGSQSLDLLGRNVGRQHQSMTSSTPLQSAASSHRSGQQFHRVTVRKGRRSSMEEREETGEEERGLG